MLQDGRTIIQQQLDNIAEVFGESALGSVTVVLGHQSEDVYKTLPSQVQVAYNNDYRTTNTSKSLLTAMLQMPKGNSILWLNGDVVFDPEILSSARTLIEADQSFVVVIEGPVADEEIKYKLDSDGFISKLSKTVTDGAGEAVGINHVSSTDRHQFVQALEAVDSQDYFEAAIELTIQNGMKWTPFYAGNHYAVEIDFPEDLIRANNAQLGQSFT